LGALVLSSQQIFHRVGQELYCEGVSLAELGAEFGTPLYVYSRRSIVERYREFNSAFEAADPLIAYSVKANGSLGILATLAGEGAGADIVSGGELFRALRGGIAPERIVFSGVGKTEPELRAALEAGIYGFNVESESELRLLSRLAEGLGVRAPVAIRVNPDIETPTPHEYTRTGHRTSKFGVPNELVLPLYEEARRLPGIEVRGIAAHIGSQIGEVEPYRLSLLHLLELVTELSERGIELEYLDIGGGYGISYGGEEVASAAEFAEVILPLIVGRGLRLVLEPGRYIVGPSGALLTSVVTVKEMGEKTFVITDTGMNDLLRPSLYDGYHEVVLVGDATGGREARVDIVGPVCETGDFLALDRELALPGEGDLIAVMTVGAYGFSMASQYNARPRPAEVLVDGRDARLIRRRETYEDLIRGETI